MTDKGLKEFAALKQLQGLNLIAPEVTDAGLKELAALGLRCESPRSLKGCEPARSPSGCNLQAATPTIA